MGGAVPRVEIPWLGGVLGASKTGGRTGEGGWRGRMAGAAVIMGAAVERSDTAVGRTPGRSRWGVGVSGRVAGGCDVARTWWNWQQKSV